MTKQIKLLNTFNQMVKNWNILSDTSNPIISDDKSSNVKSSNVKSSNVKSSNVKSSDVNLSNEEFTKTCTAETNKLMKNQDKMLNGLDNSVNNLLHTANIIHEEIKTQGVLVTELECDVETGNTNINKTNFTLNKFSNNVENDKSWWIIIFLVFVVIILILLICYT
jgi:hypothetical protein